MNNDARELTISIATIRQLLLSAVECNPVSLSSLFHGTRSHLSFAIDDRAKANDDNAQRRRTQCRAETLIVAST